MERYEPRSIEFLELWRPAGWRVKVYGISYAGAEPSSSLIEAAKEAAVERLQAARETEHFGIGFLGVHEGRDRSVAFIDWWADENELHHHLYIAHGEESAVLLRPRREDEFVACVWDLEVIAFEREQWVRHILAFPDAPRFDDYLSAVLIPAR